MNDPSSPSIGIQRGLNMEARTSMGWTEHTLENCSEIYPTRNIIGTGILCALRFETDWEFIQCWLASKRYKGFGPADMRILYESNILGGGESMRNLLYHKLGSDHSK